ncbi:MAG: hypothetical protein KGL93_14440, partial [Gemmatimonadota bacterium]|nr:hypothetical protein [Gemmatimonadota bacterium]
RTGGRRPSAAIAPPPPRPARPGAARAMAVGGKPSFSAMPYQSGVFDSLPYPPIPTLIGDTVVVTDSLGQAVFTNLNIAGYAGEAFDVVAWDTSSTNSLGSTYSPTMYLTAGAPYRVLAYYDSVHQAAGQPIVDAPELMVADSVGNGVASVPLTLSVTGGGALDSTHVTTDAGGYVSIPGWTLGTASGPNHVQATASTAGTPNAVTLTAFAHQPGALRVDVPPPTSIQDSAIFSPAVQVSVMDSTRTWFLNAPGDTIAPSVFLWPQPQDRVAPALIGTTTSVVTSSSGAALFTGLGARGSLGSTIALGFSSTGLRSDTSALISVTAGPAANIAPLAGEALDSTHVEGTSTRQVQVVVTDTAGYPVGGASVTFQITGHSSGQCTLPNGSALQALTANAQGVASVNVSLPSSAASCVIQAFAYDQNSQILPGAPVNFREFVAPPNYDVWTGLADTSWTNAGNWSSGVPTASTSVFVPYFSTFQTWGGHAVGLAAPASVNSIDVENLADVELHNSPLYVYGNLDGVPQTAHAWGSFYGGTGYVEMMTPGSVIAESFPYKLAIGDTNMSCASANPVMVAGIDSAAVVEVNCPLAIANTANTWLTSQGDVNVQHHGTVQITGAATWLYVEGSLNVTSDQSSKGLLTGGSIQVMGAGFSEDTVAGAPASYENFYSTGTGLLMENNPYGAQMAQTIRATSDSARFWSLSAANLSGYSAALSSTGAATYNVQNNLSVSSGNGVESFTIPSGVTLNAGGLSMGSTGRLYVNGTFNSASACDALQLPYIILGANGVITPASCHP